MIIYIGVMVVFLLITILAVCFCDIAIGPHSIGIISMFCMVLL